MRPVLYAAKTQTLLYWYTDAAIAAHGPFCDRPPLSG